MRIPVANVHFLVGATDIVFWTSYLSGRNILQEVLNPSENTHFIVGSVSRRDYYSEQLPM